MGTLQDQRLITFSWVSAASLEQPCVSPSMSELKPGTTDFYNLQTKSFNLKAKNASRQHLQPIEKLPLLDALVSLRFPPLHLN